MEQELSDVKKIYIKPAYSRHYQCSAEAQEDWLNNKDFLIYSIYPPVMTGRYINQADADRYSPQATIYLVTPTGSAILRKGERGKIQ